LGQINQPLDEQEMMAEDMVAAAAAAEEFD
jgi:hypothetical protein